MTKSEKELSELNELKQTLALKVESANVRKDEMAQLRHRLTKEMVDLTDEYVNLYGEESNLDGYFSADELRTIADKMDELKIMESKEDSEAILSGLTVKPDDELQSE